MVSNNVGPGIYCFNIEGSTVSANIVAFINIGTPSGVNQGDGLDVIASNHVTISGNTVGQSQGMGIFLNSCQTTLLTGNTVSDSLADGISVLNSGSDDNLGVTIGGTSGNLVFGNHGSGIVINNTPNSRVSGQHGLGTYGFVETPTVTGPTALTSWTQLEPRSEGPLAISFLGIVARGIVVNNSDNSHVLGNIVGTNASGTVLLGNEADGIQVLGSAVS